MSGARAGFGQDRAFAMLRAASCILCLWLASCSQARVSTAQAYAGPPLPPPNRIVVLDFATDPRNVSVDQGLRARITRELGDTSLTDEQQEALRQVRMAITEDLVRRLREYGLPAEAADGVSPAPTGNVVLVQGAILSVDEGNRTRRTLIGLGTGASSVSVDAQVLYRQGYLAPRLLESFSASAESGHAPGMAETMGAGAAADRVAVSAAAGTGLHAVSERRRAGNDDNARRIADALAPQLGQYFARLGWIAPPPS